MIRRPPRSTLFPYNDALPISQTCWDLSPWTYERHSRERWARASWCWCTSNCRSEEHTSELQSQSNLVCRLLLEKKKSHPHMQDRELNLIDALVDIQRHDEAAD